MIHAGFPRLVLVATLVVVSLSYARPARARDQKLALALLREGQTLLEQRHYDAARDKLAASAEQYASIETLVDLGQCNEALGRFASAWTAYRDATTLARALGRAEQETVVAERATAALAKVSSLRVEPPSHPIEGLTVRCNGDPLPTSAFGAAVPVDPGTYTLAASAPGRAACSVTVQVGKDADRAVVQLPALEPLELRAASRGDGKPTPAFSHGGFRSAVVGGGGALMISSGAVGFLALRQVKRPSADLMLCPDKQCLSEGRRQIEAAETRKLISTLGIGAGGASLCAGVYVLVPKTRGVSDSERRRASPVTTPMPSGAQFLVRGVF